MGYHVIIKSDNGLVSHYAENYEDLAFFSDISDDSIIYQGEEHWTPSVIGKDKQYSNLAKEEFRAGIKAEKLFLEQAIANNLMIEKLSQDIDSFKAYTSGANKLIKRGDYLIRNARNLEIEVKCFTFYKIKNKEFIYFRHDQYKKHQNMQEFTGAPVVIAFYQRENDSPVEESLRMISIDKIREQNNKTIKYLPKGKDSCYMIPLDQCDEKFSYIEKIQNDINSQKDN